MTILTEDCLGIPQCFQVNELELCHVRCLPRLSNSLFIILPYDCAGELLAAPFDVCSTNTDYRDKYSEVPVNVAQRYGHEQGCPGAGLAEPEETF